MDPSAGGNLALTYANDKNTDGAGAQLQRIYGIYAISRLLKIPYVHSPLKRIGYQGLAALESNSSSAGLEERYNRVFEIPSDIELPEQRNVHDMTHADLALIMELQSTARHSSEFTLVRILFPFPITDRLPATYRCVKAISPFKRTESEVFRLAIHVRRGEEMVIDSDRMLPNSYYVSCALRFADSLKKFDIPFVCELYTEVPSKAFVVTPQHHGMDGRISGDMTIDPQVNQMEDFDILPNLAKYINGDPIETLQRMATADGLILSRSSFSYVAAILSEKGIVIYHPFWHSPLNEWMISDANGLVSEADLSAWLEGWKRERRSMTIPNRSSPKE